MVNYISKYHYTENKEFNFYVRNNLLNVVGIDDNLKAQIELIHFRGFYTHFKRNFELIVDAKKRILLEFEDVENLKQFMSEIESLQSLRHKKKKEKEQ